MPPPRRISSRQRVLAQWRGVDLAPIETARADRRRSASDVVSRVLTGLKMETRRGDMEIVKVWNSLLDPTVVSHAQPVNLHKGTLFVVVDSDVWKYEIIRYHRQEILKRMQYSFGLEKIKKIHFRVG
jgi:hypothetical protein